MWWTHPKSPPETEKWRVSGFVLIHTFACVSSQVPRSSCSVLLHEGSHSRWSGAVNTLCICVGALRPRWVTQADSVSAGVQRLRHDDGEAHDQGGDEDSDDGSCESGGGCGDKAEERRRVEKQRRGRHSRFVSIPEAEPTPFCFLPPVPRSHVERTECSNRWVIISSDATRFHSVTQSVSQRNVPLIPHSLLTVRPTSSSRTSSGFSLRQKNTPSSCLVRLWMVSLKTGPSSVRTYLDPGTMASCWSPFLHVVLAGGMETSSVQVRVTLVPSRPVTRGSPLGYGGSGGEGPTVSAAPQWESNPWHLYIWSWEPVRPAYRKRS